MRLHQLKVDYDAEQDRLLMLVATSEKGISVGLLALAAGLERLARAVLARGFLVLELFGAEQGDVGGKLGILVAERLELVAVMDVDLGLDRVGAGHRRFLADQRGCGA